MNASISLTFKGDCEAAFRFYERCFETPIAFFLTWGNSPMAKDMPVELQDKVCHVRLATGSLDIAGADVMPDQYRAPQGFGILLGLKDPARAERLFNSLAEG